MALNWEKAAHNRRVREHGTIRKSRYDIAANDPLKVEARRREREREAVGIPAAQALNIDKSTFKKLNQEYKAFRLSAADSGIIAPSYNDWMRERVAQMATQAGL